jgi:ribosomal protein S12 methylthiotransferase accessory factor
MKMDPSSLAQRLEKFREYGIIGRVRRAISFTDEPKFSQWFCEPSHSRDDILEEQYGSSLALDDNASRIKSIAESLERHCSETIDTRRIINKPFSELEDRAVDPAVFVNYSDNLLKGRRNEYIEKIRKAKVSWVKGTHLNSGEQVFVPAQLVYSPYDISNEPLIRTPISTGAAFGTDENSARERGLLEIIERDSFMITWLTKRKPLIVDLSESGLNHLKEYFERYLLEPYVFDITTDLNVPSMLAVLIDRTGIGPAVSVGLKSSLDANQAALGALLEAQHVRGWVRFSYMRGNQPKIESPRDIMDLRTRGYYWYSTDRIAKLDFLLDNKNFKAVPKEKSSTLGDTPLAEYLIDKDFDIYYVDISTPEVKKEGFSVIKSIIPQLHPLLLDEDMPYDYGGRLQKYFTGEINRTPHPFL